MSVATSPAGSEAAAAEAARQGKVLGRACVPYPTDVAGAPASCYAQYMRQGSEGRLLHHNVMLFQTRRGEWGHCAGVGTWGWLDIVGYLCGWVLGW